jgi:hypothetical protein
MARIWAVLALGVLIVCTSADTWAQATAQISGTVRDQSGAVLPGVEITVTQTDTGVTRSYIQPVLVHIEYGSAPAVQHREPIGREKDGIHGRER